MKHQTLGSIAKFAGAELSAPQLAGEPIQEISTDTRTIHLGDVYMPLIGARLDGHIFIDQAFEKGALATFADRRHELDDEALCVLRVDDTMEALHRLAKNYRASLDVKIVGITGSNGKTTTKDIVNSVLAQRYATKKTIGNLNNQIGVPRTLLDLDEDTEVGIIEMGMDHAGEISRLVDLARPDIAVITNVGDVHLEFFGSKEKIAQAKLEILDQMDENGTFLYNIDNDILRAAVEARSIRPKVLTYGYSEDADYRLKLTRSDARGSFFEVNGESWYVNLLGSYQVYNAAVGVIIGQLMGLTRNEIEAGLRVEDPTAMRSELVNCDGFDILMDCYKSNPQSLQEALRTTAMLSGYRSKIAILGDMLELGETENELHRAVGEMIDPDVFDYVLFYGPLSKYMMEGALENFPRNRVFHFDDKPDLIDKAKYLIHKSTLVLVKASRGMRLEELVESIRNVTALD